ncbi:hypothetical protein [Micromonospora sp. NPDC049891]|uniref:hypothetical protein n=1 Tax=Micromonospora sp. NPDC049891 TaxID=3155655 RepID=UPI0034088F1B
MTAAVRAITIRRPWAPCIASTAPGAKRVENRGALTHHRGTLLIHEGTKVEADAYADPRVVSLLDPGQDDHTVAGAGAVIAVATLADAHHAAAGGCCEPWGEIWYHGPTRTVRAVHLVLADVRPLPRPVPCWGALGLWTPSPDVLAEVEAQYTEIEVAQ